MKKKSIVKKDSSNEAHISLLTRKYHLLETEIREMRDSKMKITRELLKMNVCPECSKKYSKSEMKIMPKGPMQEVYCCPRQHYIILGKE